MPKLITILPLLLAVAMPTARAAAAPDSDYELPPILYSRSEPTDPVAQLKQRIARGEATLEWTPGGLGYLPALLRELDIPASSQGLVFAKSSLQRQKISPEKPRATYFNDDVYVAFVQDGGLLEIAAADPRLGAVFYTIEQEPPAAAGDEPPVLKPDSVVREIGRCLNCHGVGNGAEIPGLMVKSVFPTARGGAILNGGSRIISHDTPLAERWGGWYVTGSTVGQLTRANTFFVPQRGFERPTPVPGSPPALDLADLSGLVDTSPYLTPHSDVVALMVMEHQVEAHNRFAHAAQVTLRALHAAGASAAVSDDTASVPVDDRTLQRIYDACEPLVEYLLFAGETHLVAPVSGTSTFARDFAGRGLRDGKGRSLRDLDLRSRLFRYPLSYLIYSPTFDGLPQPARERVYRRLWEVLSDAQPARPFAHLSAEDRRAIVEIVRETKRGLPDYWLDRK